MPYLAGFVTPQDYGAAANGTADDTAAVQAALNAVAAAGGGTLYVPAGTYLLSAALTAGAGVSLLGAGPGVTVLNQTSTSANGLTYTPAALAGVTVSGLSITGPGSGTGVGLLVQASSGAAPVSGCVIEDLAVSGFGSHGIELVDGVGCTVASAAVSAVTGNGIHLSAGSGNALTACVVTGSSTTDIGIVLSGVSATTISGCRVAATGGGYLISGGAACAITGCVADSVVVQSGQDGTGFKVSGGNAHSVSACLCRVNNAIGYWVTAAAANVLLETVQDVSPGGSATASIKVDSGCNAAAFGYSVVTAVSLAAATTVTLTGTTVQASAVSATGNVLAATAGLGDNGVGEIALGNAATPPTTNPTGGVALYAQTGTSTALKARLPDGTVRAVVAADVISSSNETNSTTAQQASTHLVLAVEANATYLMDAQLFVQTPSGVNFVHSWTGPSGAAMVWGDATTTAVATLTGTDTWTGSGAQKSAILRGRLTVGATAGNLTPTFASGTSGQTATLAAGSSVMLTRVA